MNLIIVHRSPTDSFVMDGMDFNVLDYNEI